MLRAQTKCAAGCLEVRSSDTAADMALDRVTMSSNTRRLEHNLPVDDRAGGWVGACSSRSACIDDAGALHSQ